MKNTLQFLFSFPLLLVAFMGNAQQDVIFGFAPHDAWYYNPAVIGTGNQLRAFVGYRNESMGIDGGGIQSQALGFGMPVASQHIGLGFQMTHDKANIIQNTNARFQFAYHLSNDEQVNAFSIGLEGGIAYQGINFSNERIADPVDLPLLSGSYNKVQFTWGAGLHYRYLSPDKVNQLNINIATTQPGINNRFVASDSLKFGFKQNLFAGINYKVAVDAFKKVKIEPLLFMSMLPGTDQLKTDFTGGLNFHYAEVFKAGLGYRVAGSALQFMAGGSLQHIDLYAFFELPMGGRSFMGPTIEFSAGYHLSMKAAPESGAKTSETHSITDDEMLKTVAKLQEENRVINSNLKELKDKMQKADLKSFPEIDQAIAKSDSISRSCGKIISDINSTKDNKKERKVIKQEIDNTLIAIQSKAKELKKSLESLQKRVDDAIAAKKVLWADQEAFQKEISALPVKPQDTKVTITTNGFIIGFTDVEDEVDTRTIEPLLAKIKELKQQMQAKGDKMTQVAIHSRLPGNKDYYESWSVDTYKGLSPVSIGYTIEGKDRIWVVYPDQPLTFEQRELLRLHKIKELMVNLGLPVALTFTMVDTANTRKTEIICNYNKQGLANVTIEPQVLKKQIDDQKNLLPDSIKLELLNKRTKSGLTEVFLTYSYIDSEEKYTNSPKLKSLIPIIKKQVDAVSEKGYSIESIDLGVICPGDTDYYNSWSVSVYEGELKTVDFKAWMSQQKRVNECKKEKGQPLKFLDVEMLKLAALDEDLRVLNMPAIYRLNIDPKATDKLVTIEFVFRPKVK